MYTGSNKSGSYIGRMLVGHSGFPMIDNGVYNTAYFSSGKVKVDGICWVPSEEGCNCPSCYTGEHVHLEACAGTNPSINDFGGDSCTNNGCTYGAKWIFRWGNA